MSAGEYTPVERAAVEWWKTHRPIRWDEAKHLEHPAVNCPMPSDQELARQVAELVKARLNERNKC